MPTFAAVDIGSNSVRLKIARLQAGRIRALHEDREVTRLGEGVFGSGFLTPDSIAETVKVLRRFHRATQQIVTDTVRVVATSALRDARNSQAFLEWVRSATGWRVEIISGVEEARLIHLGLVSSGRVDHSPTLMMDLGGGSCELTVTQGGHIRDAVSLPLGAVRLTNEFLRHDPARKGELKRLRGFIAREVNRIIDRITSAKVKNVIATSGTAAALAAVASHLRRGTRSQRLMVSSAEMTRIAKRLARLPVAERHGLSGASRSASPERLPLFTSRPA
jgi:exopolyphosphatase/guanosine-5'-triphosphate,3'-diphosphate pyrophosphatase